jgi:cell shape-determining protein MreD
LSRTPLIVLAVNVLLWTIQTQANHYLASWDLSIFLGGLCVAFASLRLPSREGVRTLLLIGFWFDAATPVPFGLHAFLFLLAHAAILTFRNRIPRDETMLGLLIATVVNLLLMLGLTIALLHRNPAPLLLWPRLIADSLVSFCLVMLLGPWFFSLQTGALEMGGVILRRDSRSLG